MQLARAHRSVCVIDAGAPRNRFAAQSHGFFGQDGTPPLEMIAQARARLLAYPTVRFVAGRAIDARAHGEDDFSVTLDDGQAMRGRRLLLAVGVRDVLPEIPGLAERWGVTMLHCPYCHGHEFFGQRLGVLYGGPGFELHALLIKEWGPTTLLLNGESIDEASATQLRAHGVAIEPARIEAFVGELPALQGARLADGRLLPLDATFVSPRVQVAGSLARTLGCAFADGPQGPLLQVDELKRTSVPGVFAAGDAAIARHNATFASADGVMAGVSLHRSLIPGL